MGDHRINFKELKQRATFEPVLARYGLAGDNMRRQRYILCPFHTESKPSCKIDLDHKRFRCFGCGANGSVLDFVARLERCGLSEAAAIVASCCRILSGDIGTSSTAPTDARNVEVRASTDTNPNERNSPLTFTLPLDSAHPYLVARGVTPELAKLFGIGYCDRGVMRGRIAIPIHDEDGNLVAYAGRWADEEIPPGTPRYLLPRKFRKQRVLYNFNRVRGCRQLVIVESYWSVFRLAGFGLPAVGLMGRELSDAQLALLRNASIERIGIMLDGDAPGRAAAAKALPDLARFFFVRNYELPDGLKPHSAPEDMIRSLLGIPS
jgi:DNA primase